MRRSIAMAAWAAGLGAACNVPLERFHKPDAPSADAAIDAADEPRAQEAYAKASNTGAGDGFGRSVALSADGSTLAVGAPREDSDATVIDGDQGNDAAMNAGAVYVLVRGGAVWSQQAYVKATNAGADDFFGISVALSADGSTLAVGAYSEDSSTTGIDSTPDELAGGAGAVYVFTRSGATWSQQAYIKASNTDMGDGFGQSVALSGDGSTLAVGAPGEDSGAMGVDGTQADETKGDSGAVYVFTRAGAAWSQRSYVKASIVSPYDAFGVSVAVSADGSTLAVGASREASATTNVGAAYVFTRSGATWSQQHRQVRGQPMGAFGNSVALSSDGSVLAVGSSREDTPEGAAGAAHVLVRSGATWSQPVTVKAPSPGAYDALGTSVALSADGSLLAVGAPFEDSAATGLGGDQTDEAAIDAGAVYVFARSGTAFALQAYVKASNTGIGDDFGGSVAMSASGAVLAVGAAEEDSNAVGVGGSQTDDGTVDAGAVYIFRGR